MANATISGAKITLLEHPISSLEDRPVMSAQDLKQYFDANPIQLMNAHNELITALTQNTGAANIGFRATAGITADTIQAAIENVHTQLSNVALSVLPDGSIEMAKLCQELQNRMEAILRLQIDMLQVKTSLGQLGNGGSQFPLMIMALVGAFDDNICSDIAAAAFGYPYMDYVTNLGEQLGWLCAWREEAMPSEAFLAKKNMTELFEDHAALSEISSHPVILELIQKSTEISRMYQLSLRNGQ